MFSLHKFYRSIILSSLLIQSYVCVLSYVQLFGTLWIVAHQAPLSMGIFKARILEWVAISYYFSDEIYSIGLSLSSLLFFSLILILLVKPSSDFKTSDVTIRPWGGSWYDFFLPYMEEKHIAKSMEEDV